MKSRIAKKIAKQHVTKNRTSWKTKTFQLALKQAGRTARRYVIRGDVCCNSNTLEYAMDWWYYKRFEDIGPTQAW